jgi:hypothetical protein
VGMPGNLRARWMLTEQKDEARRTHCTQPRNSRFTEFSQGLKSPR